MVEQRLLMLESIVAAAAGSHHRRSRSCGALQPRIVFVNDAYTLLTGFTSDEVVAGTDQVFNFSKTDRTQTETIRTALRPGSRPVWNF